jgi:hypothetical protein
MKDLHRICRLVKFALSYWFARHSALYSKPPTLQRFLVPPVTRDCYIMIIDINIAKACNSRPAFHEIYYRRNWWQLKIPILDSGENVRLGTP